jgi:hypothetical protein
MSTKSKPHPQLMLVKDDGIYLMSNDCPQRGRREQRRRSVLRDLREGPRHCPRRRLLRVARTRREVGRGDPVA